MFLLTGEGKYIDILERTLYNGFLSGVGMDGRSFYYVNPLACDGEFRFNRDEKMTRQPWYGTSCCPTNVVRLLPSLSGYIYAIRDRELHVNLYMAGRAQLDLNGVGVSVEQTTDYPWNGRIAIDLTVAQPVEFQLKLRIPSFAQGVPLPSDLYSYIDCATDDFTLSVDGDSLPLELAAGYVPISRRWEGTSRIELDLPLPVRRVVAHPAAVNLEGLVALERGPIVYALEAADNEADVLNLALADAAPLVAEDQPDLLGGVTVIRGRSARCRGKDGTDYSHPLLRLGPPRIRQDERVAKPALGFGPGICQAITSGKGIIRVEHQLLRPGYPGPSSNTGDDRFAVRDLGHIPDLTIE